MGLARKTRRKYDTPNHPWQAERIDEEKKLIDEYGLTNKKQIWKMSSLLRNFRKQARDIIGLRGERKESSIKILISNQVEGDFIAVSDSQRPLKVIEYFRKQNKTKSFISIESIKKPYQVNTGVYVLHEKLISTEVFEELFHLAKDGVTNGEQLGGDQEVINYYLEQKKDIILTYAPFIFNTSARTFAGEKFKQLKITKPVFIHYVGNKPWNDKILIYGKMKHIRQFWIKYAQKKLKEIID